MFTCLQPAVPKEPALLLRLPILRCGRPADCDRPIDNDWLGTRQWWPLTGYAALRSFAMLISPVNARLKAYGDALHAD